MYSEHGFDALMRSDSGHGCHAFTVVSNWSPGSPQSHAACAICFMSSFARSFSRTRPSVRAVSAHSASSCTARMNASVTRMEWFAFWKNTES